MKHAKKLLSLALVFAMVLALAVPAFAAGDSPVTFPAGLPNDATTSDSEPASAEGRTFAYYQIFKGTDKDGEGNTSASGADPNSFDLYEIEWGPLFGKGFLTYLQNNSSDFSDITFEDHSADAVARIISGYDDNKAKAFAKLVADYVTDNRLAGTPIKAGDPIEPGYYLIVDTTDLDNLPEDSTVADVTNLSVLFFSGATTFQPNMKVNVPTLDKKVYEVNDSDKDDENTGWGEQADYDVGDTIPYVLTGTLPTGYDEFRAYSYKFTDTMSKGLTYNGDAKVYLRNGDLAPVDITSAFTITPTINEATGETTLVVECKNLKTSTFESQISATSKIQVAYTATLGEDAVVGGEGNPNTAVLEFTRDPNWNGEGEPPTGTTPEDKVTVFTFKLTFDKVDGDGNPLEGAGFTLSKWVAAPTEEDPEDGAWEVVGKEQVITEDDFTDGEAIFNFEGLDAGKYKIEETTVPAGYNKAEDIEFTIVAVLGKDDKGNDVVTSLEVKGADADGTLITLESFTPDKTAGTLNTKIENLRGLQLPSTGGIGTTIFYVVGGILLVGAAVLLITKKRMGAAE